MSAHVEVISPGLYSSIQDRGRIGFRKFGVPTSGAMDVQSATLANHLLNNSLESAVMEITLNGPKLLFSTSTLIAISGADISPALNGNIVSLNKILSITKGDILSFGALHYGTRCYLAVKDGFQTQYIMNSHSYLTPITQQNIMKKGDILPIQSFSVRNDSFSSIKTDLSLFTSSKLECSLGPEFDLLNAEEKESVFQSSFSISKDNNRMGYRLNGPVLQYPKDYNMLTSSVLPGTVQLIPSGQLIVLMQDCQTTGGYPRILQLTQNAINILAQKKADDAISLERERS